MAHRSRPRRSPARYLAPLALVATIAGTYLIVSHSVDRNHPASSAGSSGGGPASAGGSGSGAQPANTGSGSEGSSTTGSQTATGGTSYYVVRSGDTLSEIALRNHTTVTSIEELNPGVSPNALRVGQRLRLTR